MARIGVRVEATEENTQQRDFGNIPNGDYLLEITASEVREKNEGTRDHSITLLATFDVIEPAEFKGRKVFANFNLQHPNDKAQTIGQQQFACLLRALSMSEAPEDSEELHLISFTAKIGMGSDSKEKNTDGSPKYAARNEVKKYYYPDQGDMPQPAIDAVQPPAPANDNRQSAPAAGGQAAAPAGRRPWGAKK